MSPTSTNLVEVFEVAASHCARNLALTNGFEAEALPLAGHSVNGLGTGLVALDRDSGSVWDSSNLAGDGGGDRILEHHCWGRHSIESREFCGLLLSVGLLM